MAFNIAMLFQVPTNYDFIYTVHSPYTGDDHSHTEKKTEGLTEGQYRVRLPDGRTQVHTERKTREYYYKSCLVFVAFP